MKKIASLALAVIMSMGLAGCGKSSVSLDTVGEVQNEEIPNAVYDYFLQSAKEEISQDGTINSSEADFWTKGKIDGKNAGKYTRDKAEEQIEEMYAVKAFAKKEGLDLSSEDRKDVESKIKTQQESAGGEEAFKESLEEAGLNMQVLTEIQWNAKYEEKAKAEFLKKLTTAEKKAYYKNKMKAIKHVLLKTVDDNNQALSTKEVESAKKTAKSVLQKAKAGADFEKLIRDFGEDQGMLSNQDGYAIGEYNDSYMEAFREAGWKLKIGAVSGIVETSYGYHILKAYKTKAANYSADEEAIETEMWNAEKKKITKKAKKEWNKEKVSAIPIEKETEE